MKRAALTGFLIAGSLFVTGEAFAASAAQCKLTVFDWCMDGQSTGSSKHDTCVALAEQTCSGFQANTGTSNESRPGFTLTLKRKKPRITIHNRVRVRRPTTSVR